MDTAAIDHILKTTRSVRKRLDFTRPIDPAIIEECLDIATQAPSGSNQQKWWFMVVTDPERKQAIGDLYRKSFESYLQSSENRPATEREKQLQMLDSAVFLAEHYHEVPVMLIACIEGRVEHASVGAQASTYGSILPAVWSFMLALRARGIGAAWTTLHLPFEKEVATLLGIPETVTQATLLPIAYFTGDDFKPARRVPARERTYWNSWGHHRDQP